MSDAKSLLPLKIIVYAMGIMLLGGFLWLGGKLALKANDMHDSACSNIALTLPEGTTAISAPQFRYGYWLITGQQENGVAVTYRYDSCGRLQQQVTVAEAE